MLNKKEAKQLLPISAILLILWLLSVYGLYDCPLDRFFGIPCPMCGITRALMSAADGDFRMAFYYHPLWILFILTAILFILYTLNIIRPSKTLVNIYGYTFAALILACFIWRHLTGSPVVSLHLNQSVISHILSQHKLHSDLLRL